MRNRHWLDWLAEEGILELRSRDGLPFNFRSQSFSKGPIKREEEMEVGFSERLSFGAPTFGILD